MRRYFFLLLSLGLWMSSATGVEARSSLSKTPPATLEVKDIQHFSVYQSVKLGRPMLYFSGVVARSGMAVQKVQAKKYASTLQVTIMLVPTHTKTPSAFNSQIPLPATIDRVVFGHLETPIWLRHTRH